MDFEAIRAGIESGVPFNAHVGLRAVLIEPGHAIVRLPDLPHLRNHVGTQHGSGVYLAAEAASGGAVFAAFAEGMERFTPLTETGTIHYKKAARGVLDAEATFDSPIKEILAELERSGQARFTVSSVVEDAEGQVVAGASFGWHLRRTRRRTDWTARATSGSKPN